MKKGQILYSRGYSPRQYPKRDRDEKRLFRKKIIIFLWILFLFLVLSYTLFFSPIFKIKEIKVSGNRAISNEEIRDSLDKFLKKKILIFFNKNNIFLVTEDGVEKVIFKDFPRVLSIKINKDIFKKTIDLKIVERKEAGIFCKKECYYIDEDGVIFEEAPQTSGTLILVIKDNSEGEAEMGKSIVEEKFMAELIDLRSYLSSQLNLKVLDFTIESDDSGDFKINTNEEWYILLDRSRDLKNQLEALRLVLEEKIKEGRQKLEYIDLRIENRVYYK